MVRVDATRSAKVVFCDSGVELIQRQKIGTLNDMKPPNRNRRDYCPAPTTNGTIAASRVLDPIWQFQFQHDIATMANRPVPWLNNCVADDHMSVHLGGYIYVNFRGEWAAMAHSVMYPFEKPGGHHVGSISFSGHT